jgi:phage shock protein A
MRKQSSSINDFYSEAEKEEVLEEKINKLQESLANIEKKNTRGFESDAQTSDEVDELNEKIKKYKEQLENLQ